MRRKLDRFRAVSASKVVSRCCKQFWLQLVKPIAYGLQCFGFSNSSIRAKAAISSKESSAISVLCPQGRLFHVVTGNFGCGRSRQPALRPKKARPLPCCVRKEGCFTLLQVVLVTAGCFGFSNSSIRAKAAISSKESSATSVLCPQGKLFHVVTGGFGCGRSRQPALRQRASAAPHAAGADVEATICVQFLDLQSRQVRS